MKWTSRNRLSADQLSNRFNNSNQNNFRYLGGTNFNIGGQSR